MMKDPVCGMQVDESRASDVAEHGGKTYHFCSAECRQAFQQSPERYARQTA